MQNCTNCGTAYEGYACPSCGIASTQGYQAPSTHGQEQQQTKNDEIFHYDDYSTCFTPEKNGVWYVFSAQTSGLIKFTIIPYDPVDDFDWTVIDITDISCADIWNSTGKYIIDDYYKYISESKVMIISAREETYGYQVIDAVLNNCVPIASNKFSYRDILPREYLYNNEEELYTLISKVLEGKLSVPQLLNQKFVAAFWDRMVNYMKRNF